MGVSRIVRCLGNSVINADVEAQTAWADVWISWVTGRRGKREYLGPTLIGKYDLKGELMMMRELLAKYPNCREYAREVKLYERILGGFEQGKTVYVERRKDGCPNLYTAARFIDRAEAERMIAALVKTKGIDRPVFRWVEPEIVVGEISVGHIAEGQSV